MKPQNASLQLGRKIVLNGVLELPPLQTLTKKCWVMVPPILWEAAGWEQQLHCCSLLAIQCAEPLTTA